jgi:hypothetical protein
MDGTGGRRGPVDVAALAELDAGLPDPAEAARRRAEASADPDAAAVLDALAATRADLAALPAPELPPTVAARWAAVLATEGARPADRQPRFPDALRRPRGGTAGSGRQPAWRPLVAAAVLAVVVGTGLGALVHRSEPPAPDVTRVELVALARASVGTMDVGALADPARRAACLRAVAPEAARQTLLGGRRVVLDGRPGVLLVLATGRGTALRILMVDPDCGPAGGTLLAEVVVG